MDALTKVSETGKLNLPAQMRRQVGLEQGGPVLVRVEDGEIRMRDSILRVQQQARKLFGGADSVDRFIGDRRAEVEQEGGGVIPSPITVMAGVVRFSIDGMRIEGLRPAPRRLRQHRSRPPQC